MSINTIGVHEILFDFLGVHGAKKVKNPCHTTKTCAIVRCHYKKSRMTFLIDITQKESDVIFTYSLFLRVIANISVIKISVCLTRLSQSNL